jgi:hypothetical protein
MEAITPPLSPSLRTRLIVQMVFSFTTLLLAAVLTILLSLEGFSGVATSVPLVLGTCTSTFFSTKFGEANRSILIVFFSSIVSIILQIFICIIVFPPLLMRLQPTPQRIIAAYVLCCLHTLAAVTAFGKYLTFQVELSAMTNCSVTYAPVLISIILAFAAADLLASLVQLLATIAIAAQLNSEIEEGEAYRIVSNITNNTLENAEEPAKPVQNKPATESNILPQANLAPKKEERNQSTDELKFRPYESRARRSKVDREVTL